MIQAHEVIDRYYDIFTVLIIIIICRDIFILKQYQKDHLKAKYKVTYGLIPHM